MGGLGGDTAIYGVDAAAEGIGFSFFHNGNLSDILTDILYNLVVLYANRQTLVPACLYNLATSAKIPQISTNATQALPPAQL